jgi:hypothetical protein
VAWKPDYVTAQNVADYLRVDDTVDNTQFATWATASSRAVDAATNRQFGQLAAPAARVYRRPPSYDPTTGLWLLEIDDVQDATGLLVNGVAYASSGALLLPDNAPGDGLPWERIGLSATPTMPGPGAPQLYTITAKFGWTAVPTQVPEACKLQCARWNARRDSPFGVAGSPEDGSQIRLLARLDPDVVKMLAGLSRRRKVA